MSRPVARALVGVLVAATSIGCTTKAVELPSEAPTSTSAPAPVPPETTTSSTRPPVRPIHPAVASPPVVASIAPSGHTAANGGDLFDRLAMCESGMHNDTAGPFYGYFQFLPSTWRSMGETGMPYDHDYGTQKAAAQRLVARSGWSQFPACGRQLGMR